MNVLIASLNKQVLKHLDDILEGACLKCGDATRLDEAIAKATKDSAIVCLDITSLGDDAIELVELYLKEHNGLKILALSSTPNLTEGTRLLELGVRGYVNSRLYDTHLKDAIRTIEEGNVWLYPDFIYSMVKVVSSKSNTQKSHTLDELTPKEKEIAILVLDGLSNKDIATSMNVSERTIKAHLSSIYNKFNVKDRIGFVLAMESKS